MKRKTSKEEDILSSLTNKDLRDKFWQARKAVEEYSSDFSDETQVISEENERLLYLEKSYSEELKKRELLEWAIKTGR